MRLSPRQLHVAHFGRRSTAVVIASGPVSSGKTEAAGRGWVQHTGRAFSGHNLMIVSRSHAQMLGVIVSLLARVTAKIGVPMIRRARWYDVGDAHGGYQPESGPWSPTTAAASNGCRDSRWRACGPRR